MLLNLLLSSRSSAVSGGVPYPGSPPSGALAAAAASLLMHGQGTPRRPAAGGSGSHRSSAWAAAEPWLSAGWMQSPPPHPGRAGIAAAPCPPTRPSQGRRGAGGVCALLPLLLAPSGSPLPLPRAPTPLRSRHSAQFAPVRDASRNRAGSAQPPIEPAQVFGGREIKGWTRRFIFPSSTRASLRPGSGAEVSRFLLLLLSTSGTTAAVKLWRAREHWRSVEGYKAPLGNDLGRWYPTTISRVLTEEERRCKHSE